MGRRREGGEGGREEAGRGGSVRGRGGVWRGEQRWRRRGGELLVGDDEKKLRVFVLARKKENLFLSLFCFFSFVAVNLSLLLKTFLLSCFPFKIE